MYSQEVATARVRAGFINRDRRLDHQPCCGVLTDVIFRQDYMIYLYSVKYEILVYGHQTLDGSNIMTNVMGMKFRFGQQCQG